MGASDQGGCGSDGRHSPLRATSAPTSGLRAGGEFGVGVKKVRRPTAAVVRPYRTGSHNLALRTAGDPALLSRARDVLRARVYSNSTVGPRRSRLRTVKKLLKRAGHRYLPACL